MEVKNPIKAKLKAGEVSVGCWITIGHQDISERLANVGFDWLTFDMEHAPLERETVQFMIQSMSYQNECVPIVRIPWNEIWMIKHVLDIGAYGVVIPLIGTKEDTKKVVSYCKYPPEGVRGCAPRHAAFRDKDYIKTANDEVLVVIQIETEEAVRNIDEICSVKGVDVCFVGPTDLSLSLGVLGQTDHPKFRKAKQEVVKACRKWGVAPGMFCSVETINEAVEEGFQFVSLASDLSHLIAGAKAALNKVKTHAK